MNKLLSFILTCFLSMNMLGVSAQNTWSDVLKGLTFDAPGTLYHPKGSTANMRVQPNTKARLAEAGERTRIEKGEIVNDMGTDAAWVKTVVDGKTVYISKSVMQKTGTAPMQSDFYNMPYWQEYREYDEGNMGWRAAPLKGTEDLYLAQVSVPQGYDYLMLGKKIGNVLVFKYRVRFSTLVEDADLAPVGKYSLESEVENGVKTYFLQPNRNMVKVFTARDFGENEAQYEERYLDLSKISGAIVYKIFKEVIENNEVYYFYLTSDSFSSSLLHHPC